MLDRAYALHPEHPGVCYLRGLTAQRANRPDEAVRWFELAFKKNAGSTILQVPPSLGSTYYGIDMDSAYVVALMQAQRNECAIARLICNEASRLSAIAKQMSYATAFEAAEFLVKHKCPAAYGAISAWWHDDFKQSYDDGLCAKTLFFALVARRIGDDAEVRRSIAAKLLRLRASSAKQIGRNEEARSILRGLLSWRPQDELARAALAEIERRVG